MKIINRNKIKEAIGKYSTFLRNYDMFLIIMLASGLWLLGHIRDDITKELGGGFY